jgi:hypothetical protein
MVLMVMCRAATPTATLASIHIADVYSASIFPWWIDMFNAWADLTNLAGNQQSPRLLVMSHLAAVYLVLLCFLSLYFPSSL